MKWSNVSKKAHKWSNFRIHQQHMVCENTVKLVQKNTGGPFIHSHNSTYTYTCWLKLHTTPSQLPKCPNLSTLQRPCQGGQQCFKLAVFGYLTQPCSHRRDCSLLFAVLGARASEFTCWRLGPLAAELGDRELYQNDERWPVSFPKVLYCAAHRLHQLLAYVQSKALPRHLWAVPEHLLDKGIWDTRCWMDNPAFI